MIETLMFMFYFGFQVPKSVKQDGFFILCVNFVTSVLLQLNAQGKNAALDVVLTA